MTSDTGSKPLSIDGCLDGGLNRPSIGRRIWAAYGEFPAISSAFQCDYVREFRVHGRRIGQAAGVPKPPEGLFSRLSLGFIEAPPCLLRRFIARWTLAGRRWVTLVALRHSLPDKNLQCSPKLFSCNLRVLIDLQTSSLHNATFQPYGLSRTQHTLSNSKNQVSRHISVVLVALFHPWSLHRLTFAQ